DRTLFTRVDVPLIAVTTGGGPHSTLRSSTSSEKHCPEVVRSYAMGARSRGNSVAYDRTTSEGPDGHQAQSGVGLSEDGHARRATGEVHDLRQGSVWIHGLDELPPPVRRRLANSRFNICPTCVAMDTRRNGKPTLKLYFAVIEAIERVLDRGERCFSDDDG